MVVSAWLIKVLAATAFNRSGEGHHSSCVGLGVDQAANRLEFPAGLAWAPAAPPIWGQALEFKSVIEAIDCEFRMAWTGPASEIFEA